METIPFLPVCLFASLMAASTDSVPLFVRRAVSSPREVFASFSRS